ncbi:glutathione-disulfide reductase [Parvularcula sp. IMCC14364]|uniref:glutathione-disulfide reductase n=1 Tax=Parvularcula sp. IMCC14364 TaxID=3067902 RepID=UPI00274034BA|nr:glutathione-disulfide reductase [Parvularcula sp. IMCC14364]
MSYDYDLFTIGAGSGGVRASRLASQYGAKVGIAEESRVGGTCVIRGCVPKKFFVYASEFSHAFEDSGPYGWSVGDVSFDWKTLVENKDKNIDRLNGIYITNLEKAGVELFHSRAILKDQHTVHLVGEGRDVTAEKILISAGGTPWTDESIEGHELGITSNEAFHLEELPGSIVVAGGGYIAVEFACIFAGLGVDTTLVYRGPTLLKNFDHDISEQLHKELEHKGIKLELSTIFTKIEKVDGKKHVSLTNGNKLVADQVMWAVGRRPKTVGLGLEKAGVATGHNGAIITDDHHKTSVENIYAIGDVTDRVNLTPVAIREGIAFAESHFNAKPTVMDYDFIPKAVFSQPPIGTVGMTEREARDAGHNVHIYRSDFMPMKNSLSGNPERMLMKLVVDKATDTVLGCHIIGFESPEMIQCLAIAIKHGVKKAEFDATCALHPSAAEEIVTLKVPSNESMVGKKHD